MIANHFLIKGQFLFFRNLAKNKYILLALVQKELKSRYARSSLGFAWVIFQPLSSIIIYTIIFSLVFRSTIPETYKQVPYVIFLLCGLIPYTIFSETVARSSNILLENAGMIKKMVFPYEFFPIAVFITSCIIGGVTLVLTGILMLFFGVSPSLMSIFYLLLFLVPLVLVTTGISWIISCVAVAFRDIVHVVPVILNLLFFATPVLYSYEMMAGAGEKYPVLITLAKLNPLYSIVIGVRISLIGNEFVLSAGNVFICYLLSFAIFFFGGMVFRVFKQDLADLI